MLFRSTDCTVNAAGSRQARGTHSGGGCRAKCTPLYSSVPGCNCRGVRRLQLLGNGGHKTCVSENLFRASKMKRPQYRMSTAVPRCVTAPYMSLPRQTRDGGRQGRACCVDRGNRYNNQEGMYERRAPRRRRMVSKRGARDHALSITVTN